MRAMSLLPPSLQESWSQLQAQWGASTRLRWGVWTILGILLVHVLLVVQDHVDARSETLKAHKAEGLKLERMSAVKVWAQRSKQAQDQLGAFRSMAWSESDVGLAEAAMRDWLQKLTLGLGLSLKELQVARITEPTSGSAATVASPLPMLPSGAVAIRGKLVVDMKRSAVMALLAELQRSERSLVIERLVWRGSATPAQVEIEVRGLAFTGDKGKGTAP
jgi:hypothetical protein